MDSKPIIVGLGEVLWDIFPDGAKFGGAPANFACSIASLAGDSVTAAMASAVGNDTWGRDALQALQANAVDTTWIQTRSEPTGQVHIQLDEQGQASYQFAENSAWDNLQWTVELESLAGSAAALCYGTLGQRTETSRDTIRKFVRTAPNRCLRVFDINLRPPFWTKDVVLASLPEADVLKCNEEELSTIAELLGIQGGQQSLLEQLSAQFDYRLIALTLGSEGSLLLDDQGRCSRKKAVATEVVDTVGAGDSLTAAITLGLLRGMPLEPLHDWANRVAAYVCGHAGATPGGLPRK